LLAAYYGDGEPVEPDLAQHGRGLD
jgi:hypothetical protein